jgi:hypothetical protein
MESTLYSTVRCNARSRLRHWFRLCCAAAWRTCSTSQVDKGTVLLRYFLAVSRSLHAHQCSSPVQLAIETPELSFRDSFRHPSYQIPSHRAARRLSMLAIHQEEPHWRYVRSIRGYRTCYMLHGGRNVDFCLLGWCSMPSVDIDIKINIKTRNRSSNGCSIRHDNLVFRTTFCSSCPVRHRAAIETVMPMAAVAVTTTTTPTTIPKQWPHIGADWAFDRNNNRSAICQGPSRLSSVRTRAQGHFPWWGKPMERSDGQGGCCGHEDIYTAATIAIAIHTLVETRLYRCKSTTRHPNRARSC